MAVTTKSNSYITVEVIMIALKFICYFTVFFFVIDQKMLKGKKKN